MNVNQLHPLAVWLESAGIARYRFADRIGVSPSHVTLLSQGKRGASLRVALKIERETGGAVQAKQLLIPRKEATNEHNAGSGSTGDIERVGDGGTAKDNI